MRLEMYRGDTQELDIEVQNNAVSPAAPFDLTGCTLAFTAKNGFSGSAVISKSIGSGITVTDAAAGEARILISPSDTSGLPAQVTALNWDVQLTNGASVYTIAAGQLVVNPDVTT